MTTAKPSEPTAWERLSAPFDAESVSLLPRAIGPEGIHRPGSRRCAEREAVAPR